MSEDAEQQAAFSDLTTHAMAEGIRAIDRVLDTHGDDATRGDIYINAAINLGAAGCAYIAMLLAPEIAQREGHAGVEREAMRLWRRVAKAISEAETDDELARRVLNITRSFKPRGRPT